MGQILAPCPHFRQALAASAPTAPKARAPRVGAVPSARVSPAARWSAAAAALASPRTRRGLPLVKTAAPRGLSGTAPGVRLPSLDDAPAGAMLRGPAPVLDLVRERSEAIGRPGAAVGEEVDRLYRESRGRQAAAGVIPSGLPGGASRARRVRLQPSRRERAPRARAAAPSPMSSSPESLDKALAGRDLKLTNELLTAVRRLHLMVDARSHAAVGRLSMLIWAGQYAQAREVLDGLQSVTVSGENVEAYLEEWNLLSEKLPGRDLPLSQVAAEAAQEVLSTAAGDPFQLQARLSRLLRGLAPSSLPKPLSARQVALSKSASWLARRNAEGRKGAATGPVQTGEDCWLRSIYDLPIPALDALRRTMTYEGFVRRVEALFPAKDFSRSGLSFDEFPRLMEAMGLKSGRVRASSPRELEDLLARHGALIAGLAWFDRDVSGLDDARALAHWTQHAAVITGASGPADAREYAVRDPLLAYESRYAFEELGLLQFRVYVVEAEAGSPAILERFMSGPAAPGPAQGGAMDASRLESALSSRDHALFRPMLATAASARGALEGDFGKAADELAMAIFAGRFKEAKALLGALAPAAKEAPDAYDFNSYLDLIGRLLPAEDHPAAAVLTQAVSELISSASGDPFSIQERLARLVAGYDPKILPEPLADFQKRLSREASWKARENGLARRGAGIGPAQAAKDCVLRAVYDLPVGALEPLRRALSYERFYEKAAALFPYLSRHGLLFDDRVRLLQELGLKETRHVVDRRGLEALLESRGAVMASIGWFPKGAAGWLDFKHHSVVITGATGPAGAREFIVRDSNQTHETRYTMAELELLGLEVFTVEAEAGSPERIARFAAGGGK